MEISKSLPNRHEIAKLVKEKGQDYDVLYRKSDGRGPFGIPFMKWVAKYTGSKMTHAAILLRSDDEPCFDDVLELSDTGLTLYRFIDWLNFCIDGEFELHRKIGGLSAKESCAIEQLVIKIIQEDVDYDATFSKGYYCTKMVCKIYEAAGLILQKPKTFREMFGWLKGHRLSILNKIVMKLSNGQYGLPADEPLYFVGNETNGGMKSATFMERIL